MRWLLTTWGSRGDLHPFLAVGQGLRARGHEVTLVGHPDWEAEAVAAGLRFVGTGEPVHRGVIAQHPEIISTKWGGLSSLRALVRLGMEPSFEPMLAALMGEAPQHDVIVAHHFVFAAQAAAELAGKPLVTVFLAPGVEPSAYSRPGPDFGRAGNGLLARMLNRMTWAGGKLVTRMTVDPAVNAFRQRHGLKPVRGAVFSEPGPSLRLYSGHFAPRPPDWNTDRRPSGFCFFDPAESLPAEIEDFLDEGDAPVLCTLGSAAVEAPGDFYRDAARALESLGLRGILLLGLEENRPAGLPASILAVRYASFGALMPRVRAVVHQCGIGTLSHVLRAGMPSVACPFAFDQPNNARRLEELGVAAMLRPGERSARSLARALRRVLEGGASRRAGGLGRLIQAEDGVTRACARLEEMASTRR